MTTATHRKPDVSSLIVAADIVARVEHGVTSAITVNPHGGQLPHVDLQFKDYIDGAAAALQFGLRPSLRTDGFQTWRGVVDGVELCVFGEPQVRYHVVEIDGRHRIVLSNGTTTGSFTSFMAAERAAFDLGFEHADADAA